MHHIYPVFVEARSGGEAEDIAVCIWSGCPSECEELGLWPPPARLSWEKGIYWDYVDVHRQIVILDKELELAGVDPKEIKHLRRCEYDPGFCVDFPLRVSELGLDIARAIALSALKWGVLALVHEEDGGLVVERDIDKVMDILREKQDRIWVVYVDLHE